ncbi:aldolase/citrate lyase family protein [Agromyces sp. PvR057]|uniref:HpcH/HpaI aldolase family protein n=1 Tax=Agromyces sp. PvR057 TaxID=3156403 RepID=UPI000E271838
MTSSTIAAPSIGAWSMLGTSAAASVMARIGADWLVLDAQHGLYDDRSVVESLALLTAGGMAETTHVRVPHNSASWIGRALDAGARGVIVPMVQNAEQARAAADACRYAPAGTRSWGPMSAYWGGTVPTAEASNARVQCAVMVETPQAIADVEAIAAVPGVDMVFVGPFDLAIALGTTVEALLADTSADSPLDRVVAACTAAGIVPGSFAGSIPIAAALVARGFRSVAVAVDTAILTQHGGELVQQARRAAESA